MTRGKKHKNYLEFVKQNFERLEEEYNKSMELMKEYIDKFNIQSNE